MVPSSSNKDCPLNNNHLRLYLDRIGYTITDDNTLPLPCLETLEIILDKHIKTIPFGGLSLNYYTVQDTPVNPIVNQLEPNSTRGVSPDPLAVFDKLVNKRREGFCFEQNSLLKNILECIGFECIATCARIFDPIVMETTGEEHLQDITHWVILVKINEINYLVDGGFSHYSTLRPVPVDINAKPTECEGKVTHRIIKDYHRDLAKNHETFNYTSYRLEVQYGTSNWRPLYTFGIIPYYQRDLEVLNFYFIHNPHKVFFQHLMVSKFIPNGYISLLDDELVTRIDGIKTKIVKISNEQDRRRTFREVFGIEIPDHYKEHLPNQLNPHQN